MQLSVSLALGLQEKAAWRELEQLHKEGKIRVFNFIILYLIITVGYSDLVAAPPYPLILHSELAKAVSSSDKMGFTLHLQALGISNFPSNKIKRIMGYAKVCIIHTAMLRTLRTSQPHHQVAMHNIPVLQADSRLGAQQ